MYPNPATNQLYVRTSGTEKVSRVEITYLTGKVVYTAQHEEPMINIGELTPGIYILRGYADGFRAQYKFVKQ